MTPPLARRDLLAAAGAAAGSLALGCRAGRGGAARGVENGRCEGGADARAEREVERARRLAESRREAPHLPRPNAAQLAWQRAELGAVFHWDLHVFDGRRYSQPANRRTPIADPNLFRPSAYDVDQWFEAVRGMGARFALLTACHETGFRLWPSRWNEFSTRALAWGGGRADVVGDFVAAARRHGIAPGLYYGARWNAHLGVMDFRVTERSPLSQADYNRLVEREVEELCTNYGELFELWFDGGLLTPEQGGPDVLPIVERHQPACLFYHSDQRRDARWGGSESGTVPDPCWATVDPERVRTAGWSEEKHRYLGHGDPDGRAWCPAMADAPLRGANGRHEWFWEPGDEGALHSLDALVAMSERSIGRGATLIVGLTPDPRGLVPDPDTRRCVEWGAAVRARYGRPIAETSGAGVLVDLPLPGTRAVGAFEIAEEIEHGQRIRAWRVLGLPPERPVLGPWRELASGTAVGQRRLVRIEPAGCALLRLEVTAAAATPLIRRFAAHRPV